MKKRRGLLGLVWLIRPFSTSMYVIDLCVIDANVSNKISFWIGLVQYLLSVRHVIVTTALYVACEPITPHSWSVLITPCLIIFIIYVFFFFHRAGIKSESGKQWRSRLHRDWITEDRADLLQLVEGLLRGAWAQRLSGHQAPQTPQHDAAQGQRCHQTVSHAGDWGIVLIPFKKGTLRWPHACG